MTSRPMTAVLPHADAAEGLRQLPKTLKNYAGFREVVEALAESRPASIDGVWGSACALVAVALAEESPAPLVVVLPSHREAEDTAVDIELFTAAEAEFFPAAEVEPGEQAAGDEAFGQRLRVLKGLLREAETPRTKNLEPKEAKARGTGLGQFMKRRAD